MPTKSERTALIFLSVIALTGGAVRVVSSLGGEPSTHAENGSLTRQREALDRAAPLGATQRGAARGRQSVRPASAARGAAPRAKGATRALTTYPDRGRQADVVIPKIAPPAFPIDVDHATAIELERLPRIGPSLAARIVAERTAKGPFGSLEALDRRVKGIGPSLAAAIRPVATFSGR